MIEKAPSVIFNTQTMKMLGNPEVRLLMKNINDEYLYWDKTKYKPTEFDPKVLWSLVKYSRSIPQKNIMFNKYQFTYYQTDYISKLLHQFDMNFGGQLGANSVLPEKDKQAYLISSIMEEAISSSQIEGANTTRKRAKDMLRKGISPKTKSEKMIVNNYHTIQYIVNNKSDDLSVENLLYIHGLISKGTLDEAELEGKFRNSNDVVVMNYATSDIVHTPPKYQELSCLVEELTKFFNKDEEEFIHPLIKGVIIHFMIGWIHPFADGNGRTARALFYWYLLKKGYWLTEYLSISKIIQDTKVQYEKAYLYTETDENDLNYFLTYNFKVMDKAFESLKKYIQRKQQQQIETAKFVQISGVNERQAQILKLIYDNPEVTLSVKDLENRYVISEFTARKDLKELVQLDYLQKIKVNKVKSNFIKSHQFDSIIREKLGV